MKDLILNNITKGMPGITMAEGANLLENFVVMMNTLRYDSPQNLSLSGDLEDTFNLCWHYDCTEQMRRTYLDEEQLTERSAVCISVLLSRELTDYTVIQRSWKGTGCDYFLGTCDENFINIKARLEVSGIKKENATNTVANRFKQKEKQLEQSDNYGIPAYISIIEFSKPLAFFKQK